MRRVTRQHIFKNILRNQQSFALLNLQKPSPLSDFTFLESNFQLYPTYIQSKIKGLRDSTVHSISNYINQIERLEGKLVQITKKQINSSTLQDQDIQNLSKMFKDVKFNLQIQTQKLFDSSSIQKLPQITYLTGAFNILQYQTWNKLIVLTSKHYKNIQLQQKQQLLDIIRNHLLKYTYPGVTFQNHKIKFIMRQTHLQDLVDFAYFIKCTQQLNLFKNNQNIDFGIKFKLLKHRIGIISKISHPLNIKNYYIRDQFQSFKGYLSEKFVFMNMEELLIIYEFYAKLSLDSSEFIQKIQANIHSKLQSNPMMQQKKSKFIKKFISIWKIQGRSNHAIFQNYIQPSLITKIQKLQQDSLKTSINPQFIINLSYNLICCGFKQTGISQRIIRLIKNSEKSIKMKQNVKTYQILSQYLKITELKKTQQDLNPMLQQILSSQPNNAIQKPHETKTKNKQAIQFNPAQFFWINAIKRVIANKNIYKSIYISQFEIDILVKYKQKYFAFEIQGSHYKRDSGNLKIKQEILKCFGIKIIFIDCNDIDVKIIMRFQDIQEGEKYILKVLEERISDMVNSSIGQN